MTLVLEKVSRIHETYLLDQQLFCWRHFSKTEVVQDTDLDILALQYLKVFQMCPQNLVWSVVEVKPPQKHCLDFTFRTPHRQQLQWAFDHDQLALTLRNYATLCKHRTQVIHMYYIVVLYSSVYSILLAPIMLTWLWSFKH